MKKINIAELLKDCPKGMELDCTTWDSIVFEEIDRDNIVIFRKSGGVKVYLTRYGELNTIDGKCIIFPKGKTTWEGFASPCKFKDGDIVVTGNKYKCVAIFKSAKSFYDHEGFNYYVLIPLYIKEATLRTDDWIDGVGTRLATDDEKEKLFKAIKENGYRWNAETKTLEELVGPKFHEGDWVTDGISKCQIRFIDDTQYYYSENCILGSIESVDRQYHLWTIQDAKDGDVLFHSDSASNGIFIFKEISQRGATQKVICYCDYDSEDGFCLGENHTCCWADSKILHPATKEQCELLFQKIKEAGYKWNKETKTLEKLAQPKFKVGDKVRGKYTNNIYTISGITPTGYKLTNGQSFDFDSEDCHELVPNKFDITTLKPFSEVLVRYDSDAPWMTAHFSHYMKDAEWELPYFASGACFRQCIPYKGNEHLRGTTNDCEDFYKTWK